MSPEPLPESNDQSQSSPENPAKKTDSNNKPDRPSENAPKPKDVWDIIDIVGKSIFAITIPTILTVWSIHNQSLQAAIAKEDRKAEVLVEALSSQDLQRTTIKKDMFQQLTEDFFAEGQKIDRQIVILELLSLNFSNRQFKLSPLFVYLRDEIKRSNGLKEKEKEEYLEKLNRVVEDLKAEEVSQILGTGGITCRFSMSIGEEIQFSPPPASQENENSSQSSQSNIKSIDEVCESIAPQIFPIKFKLLDVQEKEKTVTFEYYTDNYSTPFKFKVTNFDTPFSDNTQVINNEKITSSKIFSIILENSQFQPEPKQAEINFIVFPEYFYRSEVSPINLDRLLGERFIIDKFEDQGRN